MTGTVKFFNHVKGFGFIHPDGAKPSAPGVFVHARELDPAMCTMLESGDRVKFTLVMTSRGKEARGVSLAEITTQPDEATHNDTSGDRQDP